jgi:deazaflavin-dependent oxidoreductase (nitroreductase family)
MTGPDDASPEPRAADASATGPDRPLTPFQERLGRVAVQWMAGVNAVAFRMSGGRVAARVPGGAPICLVTTTGRRTGRPRTVPLLYLPSDGDEIVLVASHGGMSSHPAWYLNLSADPRAVVDIGRTRTEMTARPATRAERAELWPRLVASYPRFETYRRRTDRVIPLVILRPIRSAGAPPDRSPPAGPR